MKIDVTRYSIVEQYPQIREQLPVVQSDSDQSINRRKLNSLISQKPLEEAEFTDIPSSKPLTSIDIYV